MYAEEGRPSIAPERLLRALLLQALFTIRSERQLMQQISYNMLFRWFVGLAMKCLRPKDGSGEPPAPGRNGERDFHGEKRSNQTHASTTIRTPSYTGSHPGQQPSCATWGMW